MLESGCKVLLAHRRLFEKDEPRYFVGEVLEYDHGVVKIRGYSFVRNLTKGDILRKDDIRTKIISVASGTVLVYELPQDSDIESARFETIGSEFALTDGKSFKMNMAERATRGQI